MIVETMPVSRDDFDYDDYDFRNFKNSCDSCLDKTPLRAPKVLVLNLVWGSTVVTLSHYNIQGSLLTRQKLCFLWDDLVC